MKIRIIKTRIIEMTREEASKFLALVKTAVEGQMVHSASTPLADGTHLGVTVLTPEQEKAQEDEKHVLEQARQSNYEARERYKAQYKANGGY